MYESFFKLEIKPFDLLPNPAFLFLSRSHKRALTYLDYGMRERAGFILLTGAVGSGKSTILRDLVKRKYDHVIFSKVFNTHVSFEQLIAMINDDFGLPVQGKDKVALLRDLNDFLIDEYAKGNRPTLIIDEAQNLTSELLEEIRMLSNLETDNAKLLQIILVGQPELRKTLAVSSLLQLRQRMGINCHLQPLSRSEIEEYIFYRLEIAGNRNAISLTPEALDVIYKYSRGIPRLVNIICDFLMLAAFAEESTNLDVGMVRDVIGDLDFENQFWRSIEDKGRSIEEKSTRKEDVAQPATILSEDCTVISNSEFVSELQSVGKRLETMEKALVQIQHSFLNDFGRSMRLLQDNRSALNEVGTMVISLTKDMARFSEESVRLQEIVVGLTEFLHEYFSGREVRKLKTGLLRRMLGEKQTS
jgi:putative secretion ATPase (PEP-CTERM system associated)